MNHGGPVMSRDEFEARRAELKRKRDFEKRGGTGRLVLNFESYCFLMT